MDAHSELSEPEIRGFKQVIKNFAPSWFASVMGTGIFAVTSKYYSCYWPWLNSVAVGLWILNGILFCVLLIPWITRWFLFADHALRDLNHPITGQFYATLPIGCLVLAVDFLVVGTGFLGMELAVSFAKACWVLGAILAVVFAIATPVINFFNKVTIADLNPAWFMPPVSLIVAPIAGAKLLPHWPQYLQKLLLLINYAFWGMGFFLFIFLAVICFYRLIVALCRAAWFYHLDLPGSRGVTCPTKFGITKWSRLKLSIGNKSFWQSVGLRLRWLIIARTLINTRGLPSLSGGRSPWVP